jgi:hypothetical protein
VQTKAPKLQAVRRKVMCAAHRWRFAGGFWYSLVSLVGKQGWNFRNALVVVENCANPVLRNMHLSRVSIQKLPKPVILYVKVPSTYIYIDRLYNLYNKSRDRDWRSTRSF